MWTTIFKNFTLIPVTQNFSFYLLSFRFLTPRHPGHRRFLTPRCPRHRGFVNPRSPIWRQVGLKFKNSLKNKPPVSETLRIRLQQFRTNLQHSKDNIDANLRVWPCCIFCMQLTYSWYEILDPFTWWFLQPNALHQTILVTLFLKSVPKCHIRFKFFKN